MGQRTGIVISQDNKPIRFMALQHDPVFEIIIAKLAQFKTDEEVVQSFVELLDKGNRLTWMRMPKKKIITSEIYNYEVIDYDNESVEELKLCHLEPGSIGIHLNLDDIHNVEFSTFAENDDYVEKIVPIEDLRKFFAYPENKTKYFLGPDNIWNWMY